MTEHIQAFTQLKHQKCVSKQPRSEQGQLSYSDLVIHVSHALTALHSDTLTTDGAVRGWEVQDLLTFPLCAFKGNKLKYLPSLHYGPL